MTAVAAPLEVEARVQASPETVFSYFTDPDKYRRWMGAQAELDPRPGGIYRVNVDGRNFVRGHFVEIEPPSRLVITWGWEDDPAIPPGSTTVEIRLIEDGDGTIVRIRHSGLPNEPARKQHEEGWRHYAGRLAVVGSGGDPGPDPLATE
jgi:uncharacterized protein YndB with AHSA1/START domain